MNRLHLAPLLSCCFLLFTTGCAGEAIDDPSEEEDVAETSSAVIASNGIVLNGIVLNGIVLNGIVLNAITPGAMASSAMAVLQADSQDGSLNRQFIKYAVGCALTSGQSFTFSWTDSAGIVRNEVYQGSLGIAPGWATGPLTDETQQRLVSACLAARTNRYGVPVLVSLRSRLDPLRTHVQSPELAEYSNVEGAFFGNIFSANPHIYACYEDSNIGLARSMNRECAAGHVDANGQIAQCGEITILGSCNDWCHNLDNHERWYHDCDIPVGGGATQSSAAAVVVALPDLP